MTGFPYGNKTPAPGRGRSVAARRALCGVILPFLATRLGLLLIGLLATQVLGSGLPGRSADRVVDGQAPAWIDIWARWDAEWYLLIAEEGYGANPGGGEVPEPLRPTDTIGFFPLYPLLIRALSATGTPPIVAGVVIANTALLIAVFLLAALVRRDFGDRAARRAVWALLTFPTSLFFSAVYAESLLLCSALGALLLARRRRPLAAGVLGGLCTLTRPVGVLIVIPLFSELLFGTPPEDGWSGRQRASRLTACFLPAGAALLGLMLYGRALTGSLTSLIERQVRWRGEASGPWRALQRYLEDPALHDAHHSTIDLAIALLLIASIPFLFRLLPRSWALYGTAMILAPLGTSLWSFSRLAAVIFPVHVALALVTERRRGWFAAYLALAIPLSAAFMALYATWRWAG